MTFDFLAHPEVYNISKSEATDLGELIFSYLACTIGPSSHKGSRGWTSGYSTVLVDVLHRAYLRPSVPGAATYLIGRYKQKHPETQLSARDGVNMFIAALVIADKCINDRAVGRKYWPKIINYSLSLSDLSRLEMEFLDGIQWNTSLPSQVFGDFEGVLKGWKIVRRQRYPIDFFTRSQWDGARPPAFDFFDGFLEQVYTHDMFFPDFRQRVAAPSIHPGM